MPAISGSRAFVICSATQLRGLDGLRALVTDHGKGPRISTPSPIVGVEICGPCKGSPLGGPGLAEVSVSEKCGAGSEHQGVGEEEAARVRVVPPAFGREE